MNTKDVHRCLLVDRDKRPPVVHKNPSYSSSLVTQFFTEHMYLGTTFPKVLWLSPAECEHRQQVEPLDIGHGLASSFPHLEP